MIEIMSNYGHNIAQYYGEKIIFPDESFLIAGVSYYQENIKEVSYNSKLTMETEPENKYDPEAIKILLNNVLIGYVPNQKNIKDLCKSQIDKHLLIINIKKEPETKNMGVRVIPEEYYSDNLQNLI